MHILVTNDDGPPSVQSSPYIHPFISALTAAGHLVSVILPHEQRSWIGKAHFVSQVVQPKFYTPSADPYSGEEGSRIHELSSNHGSGDGGASGTVNESDWVLIEGTPATCTQLGLFHLFNHRPPIDLVISGPNYGRNVTTLFSLSSGTLGGAMEAATFQRRAIALSFAFWSRVHDPELIDPACRLSVRIAEHLMNTWGDDVDLYSVNVPLVRDLAQSKIFVAPLLQNSWRSGSCFEQVSTSTGEEDADAREQVIREGKKEDTSTATQPKGYSYRWKPNFSDVGDSIEESSEGNDGWAIANGHTSITPLKASFSHAAGIPFGELKL